MLPENDWVVTKAQEADIAELSKFHATMNRWIHNEAGACEAWIEERAGIRISPVGLQRTQSWVENNAMDPQKFFLRVVKKEEKGEIIGFVFAWCNPEKPKEAFLDCLYVAENYHGGGVAYDLMKQMTNWADKHGMDHIRLETVNGNDRAARFYEKLGFHAAQTPQTRFEELTLNTLTARMIAVENALARLHRPVQSWADSTTQDRDGVNARRCR